MRVFAPTAESLATLQVRAKTPPTALVPLGQLATISTGAPEVEIDRENLKTYFGITARLEGRDLGSAMTDVQRVVAQQHLPSTMTVEYGGLYEQQQQSFRGLLYVLLAGLLLVGVVVLFEFADWRAPIIVSLCAVAVLAGVLVALVLTGQTLNISSYVGAIMMVGIVGENAIFVIHEARLGLLRGMSVSDAWREASHRRLRPVAMTILATAFCARTARPRDRFRCTVDAAARDRGNRGLGIIWPARTPRAPGTVSPARSERAARRRTGKPARCDSWAECGGHPRDGRLSALTTPPPCSARFQCSCLASEGGPSAPKSDDLEPNDDCGVAMGSNHRKESL